MHQNETAIKGTLVPESQRLNVADKHFGIRFPMIFELMVYRFTEQLAEAYTGGYWHFYTLSNGGFYMAPNLEDSFALIADNGYTGTISADALGITACLYTYSQLSFSKDAFGQSCTKQYHLLYAFAMAHPEAKAIRAAID